MLINVGLRLNVRLFKRDMWNYDKFKVNQLIDVLIDGFDNEIDNTIVSRRGLGIEESWTTLQWTHNNRAWIDGQVVSVVVESYIMKVFDLLALLSIDSVGKDDDVQLNRLGRYKVSEIKREENLITLYRSDESFKSEFKRELNVSLKEGDIVWGIVNKMWIRLWIIKYMLIWDERKELWIYLIGIDGKC